MHGGDLGRKVIGPGGEHSVFPNLKAHRGSLLQALTEEFVFHDAGAQDQSGRGLQFEPQLDSQEVDMTDHRRMGVLLKIAGDLDGIGSKANS